MFKTSIISLSLLLALSADIYANDIPQQQSSHYPAASNNMNPNMMEAGMQAPMNTDMSTPQNQGFHPIEYGTNLINGGLGFAPNVEGGASDMTRPVEGGAVNGTMNPMNVPPVMMPQMQQMPQMPNPIAILQQQIQILNQRVQALEQNAQVSTPEKEHSTPQKSGPTSEHTTATTEDTPTTQQSRRHPIVQETDEKRHSDTDEHRDEKDHDKASSSSTEDILRGRN